VCAPNSVNITNPAVTAGSSGGTTITYWTNATGTSALANPSSITTGGTYYIESSNGGCSVIDPVVVSINTTPVLVTNNVVACLPNNADLTAPVVTNGSTGGGTLTYWMNAGATLPLINPNAVTTSGTYYIVSANGSCADTAAVGVTFNTGPVINITNADTTIQFGNSVQLNATGGVSYTWSGTWGLSCSNCPDPIASPPVTMTYTVTATDSNSCTGSDSVRITILQGENMLYIPNCITPNKDGDNEFFMVYGVNIKTINMKIFDRWGELIFESDDIKKGWDGRYKYEYVQTGVYVYAVECEWNDGNKEVRRGSVTVIY
jgi:gliding motility-associated-like protein